MKLIADISKMIKEELHDAEKYIKCALRHKDERPVLARTFYQLSEEEMDHQKRLHEQVANIITEYRNMGNQIPPGMQEVYDYMHEQQIEDAEEVRRLQQMYRE